MKFLKGFAFFILLLGAAAALYLDYMGMFSSLNIDERQLGPYTYAYEEFTGPYQNTMHIFAGVREFLSAQGVAPGNGLGVYFDNPSQVPAYKLRSNCGSIITETDSAKLSAVQLQLKIGNIEQMNCVVVEFPMKNFLSFMLAPMKVYPVISRYMTEKGYKPRESYEFYDMTKKKIIIAVPISK